MWNLQAEKHRYLQAASNVHEHRGEARPHHVISDRSYKVDVNSDKVQRETGLWIMDNGHVDNVLTWLSFGLSGTIVLRKADSPHWSQI